MPITIRTATMDDAEILQAFAAKLFAEDLPGIYRRDTPTLEQEAAYIRARIEPDRCTLMLAEDDGEVVGLIDFLVNGAPEEAHGGVFSISVAQGRRGQGVGSALIEALLAWAAEQGISRVQAYGWANNPRAIALYERHGFVREGLLVGAIVRDGEEIDVVALARRV